MGESTTAKSEIRVKTVPYAPLSHPFVERLIGTIRVPHASVLMG
jgi:hypothetical protein